MRLFLEEWFPKIFSGAHRASVEIENSATTLGMHESRLHRFMDSPLGIEFRRDNLAIPHMDDAISEARRFWIVGDHHDGLTEIFVGLAQHVENDVGILGIQVSGRFVGEHDGRFVDECSGQRYALLFSARQLRWTMWQPVCEPQQSDDAIEVGWIAFRIPSDVLRDINVGLSAQCRQQVEFLKNESDLSLSHSGSLSVGEAGKIRAVDLDSALISPRQATQQIEKSRLAASGRANDAYELAAPDGE
jgi:hypothetical protein